MREQSNEAILRRYLLADLDEVQRGKIEDLLFADEGFAEELTRAEADLVDDYALAVLSKRDRELFEQNFILTDERRRDLLFAQTVDAYVGQEISRPVEAQQPWQKRFLTFLKTYKGWNIAAAATAAVILLVLFLPVRKWFGPTDQLALMKVRREQMERRLVELNQQTQSSPALPAVQLSLPPSNLLRSGGEFKQIEIGRDVGLLNLTFVLPDAEHRKYTVIARKVEGDILFSVNDLSPEANGAPGILLTIPTEFLPTDDYQFEVKGIGADGTSTSVGLYNLRVVNPASRP